MKKALLSFIYLLISFCVQATVLVDESFNYTTGAALGEVEGWTTTGTITTGEGRIIQATPLSYSNAGGEYVLSGTGKSLLNSFTASEGGVYMSYKSFAKVNSGVVYLSYLYQANGNQGQSQSEIFGISNGNTGSSVKAWAGKQSDATTNPFRLGITRASTSSGDIQWCNDNLVDKSDVVLIVLKYDFTSQAAYLYINPEVGTTEEPTADVADTDKGTAKSSMEYLMFRHNGNSKANFYIGGVRVSTTWAEAVAAKGELPTDVTLESINTNFNDGTWGEVTSKDSPKSSGSFGSSILNGFELASAYMLGGSLTYTDTGEKFTNRIAIDKKSEGGTVTLPALRTVRQIVVYASSGGDDKSLTLQKYNYYTAQWTDVATYSFTSKSTCYRFSTILNCDEVTKLRLANDDSSYKYIGKITTYPTVTSDKVLTDFSDTDIWGSPAESLSSGSFPSSEVAGFVLTKAGLENKNIYAPTGEKFQPRMSIDTKSKGGIITLPELTGVARIDIYASVGGSNPSFTLDAYNYNTDQWATAETFTCEETNTCYRFSKTLSSDAVTHLRIANADGSVKFIWKIVTYPTAPTDLVAPTALTPANVTAHAFTARWEEVDNANGYRVVVYKSDGSTQTVKETAAGVTSLNITSLTPGTDYSYKVAAIGDDDNYVDSFLSDAIDVTTAAEITDSYTRTVTNGNYGTICLPKASGDLTDAGAIFYEVAGKVLDGSQLQEIVLDEVTVLEAGKPYVFQATAEAITIPLTGDAVENPDNSSSNGLTGSFTVTKVGSSVYKFILSGNKLYCTKNQEYYVGENRAYFDINSMSVFGGEEPAPGRRRVRMTTEDGQVATGVNEPSNEPMVTKRIVNGQIVIIRNGEMYDLTGQRRITK